MTLLDVIPEGALVALDTVIWIYEVEAHPVFGPVVHPFFADRLGTGRNRAGSSLLALGELLVQPLALGRLDIADAYKAYFTLGANFAVWEVTREVVERAADLRARYRLKMMDALHMANAIVQRADLFLTNDESLGRVSELHVVTLTSFVAKPSP